MSLGPIMGVGGVAMMIPPSALAVVLASLARMDVGRLLIAGIIPGVLLGLLYIAYVMLACLIKPGLAPAYDISYTPFWEKVASTVIYIFASGLYSLHGNRGHFFRGGNSYGSCCHRDAGDVYISMCLQKAKLAGNEKRGLWNYSSCGDDIYDHYRFQHI